MRVLVLHSDVPPDAPADEQDTLIQAGEIADALREGGHRAACAAFVPDKEGFRALVANARPDAIFNVVESVWAEGKLASVGATFLAASGVPYTGAAAAPMATTADKVLTKRLLAAAGVATAPWSEPPRWDGLAAAERWIVKSIDEDASLGLDDGAVVSRHDVAQRANISAAQHGGRWFAEAFIDGREFNVAEIGRAHV